MPSIPPTPQGNTDHRWPADSRDSGSETSRVVPPCIRSESRRRRIRRKMGLSLWVALLDWKIRFLGTGYAQPSQAEHARQVPRELYDIAASRRSRLSLSSLEVMSVCAELCQALIDHLAAGHVGDGAGHGAGIVGSHQGRHVADVGQRRQPFQQSHFLERSDELVTGHLVTGGVHIQGFFD